MYTGTLREAHAKLTRDYQEGITTRVLDHSQVISDFHVKIEAQDQVIKELKNENILLQHSNSNFENDLKTSKLQCESLATENGALKHRVQALQEELTSRAGEIKVLKGQANRSPAATGEEVNSLRSEIITLRARTTYMHTYYGYLGGLLLGLSSQSESCCEGRGSQYTSTCTYNNPMQKP